MFLSTARSKAENNRQNKKKCSKSKPCKTYDLQASRSQSPPVSRVQDHKVCRVTHLFGRVSKSNCFLSPRLASVCAAVLPLLAYTYTAKKPRGYCIVWRSSKATLSIFSLTQIFFSLLFARHSCPV